MVNRPATSCQIVGLYFTCTGKETISVATDWVAPVTPDTDFKEKSELGYCGFC